MNELTHHLSIRYNRPISSIAISLQHGMCLLFGGSFEPAYIMTITALADQVKADTNRRNAALFQSHLQQALRVTPTRGIVLFVPIVEECLANGGAAAMGASVGQGLQGHDDRNGEGGRSKVSILHVFGAYSECLICLVDYFAETRIDDIHGVSATT